MEGQWEDLPDYPESPGEKTEYPVILDWMNHYAVDQPKLTTCGRNKCVFTKDRAWFHTNHTQAIVFYGTDFELTDLPLPRKSQHLWTLTHEESPKNNILFSFKEVMEMFNITSTFRRESHYPLTTQYVRSIDQIESKKWTKTFKEKTRLAKKEKLASVVYVQSDCGTPSDRDRIVKLLSDHIKVDSYGSCLHNKDLPEHLVDPIQGMVHNEFLELISKYKFAIAMENGLCTDYITEKFWRPLVVGTVPITLGSPRIKDFAPSNHSIIDLGDFASVRQLADLIFSLSNDEEKYEEYRSFKTEGVTNELLKNTLENREWEPDFDVQENYHRRNKPNYPTTFECFLCDKLYEVNLKGSTFRGDLNHYGCPWPLEFTDANDLSQKKPFSDMWYAVWQQKHKELQKFLQLSDNAVKPVSKAALDGY